MIDCKFNVELDFSDSKFEEDIIKKDIVEYINATRLNKTYPRKLKILSDTTKANMILTTEDLEAIVQANLKSLQQYDYIIDAIITERPKETAYSLLYKKLSTTNKYRFDVFSTREAAIEWLTLQ